ncbi:MAG TPA: amidohydrolase family protein [Acidimicrobiales bacterium]|nr:amidohydrolase family protein [Acidimicrobiales bacterium]
MIVDLHAHVIPDRLAPVGKGEGKPGPSVEPGEDAATRLLENGPMRFSASQTFFASEARLEALDANGVDAEVVSPMPPLLDYSLPAEEGLELSRRVNEFVVRLCEAEPNRLLGLGMVPLQDAEVAATELAEVKAMGLKGVEIASNAGGRSLGDEHFFGFFEEAERLELPVFVHALNPTLGERLTRAAGPTFAVTTEIAITAASIVTGGLAQRCPNLRLCFSHGAGGFPLMLPRAHWFWGRTWDELPTEEKTEGPSPTELARQYYYDALVFDRRALRFLIDLLGQDRLVIGTDFPAMPREQPIAKTLRSMDLPADVLEDICWNNAFRFLGIEPPKGGGAA